VATTPHNPYQGKSGEWIRGNLHGHSRPNSNCASVPLAEGVRRYRDSGAQFMAVTDHDWVTDLSAVRAAYPDMILLSGFEHSKVRHMVFVGERVPPLYELPLDDALARADDLLTIISHPQSWAAHPEWTQDRIRALPRLPDGMEVWNGHYGTERLRAKGLTSQYVRFWDELLTAGYRLWGFANDDFHDPVDLGNAFSMVLVPERTPAAIVRATKAGCFYASTGLTVDRITGADGHIAVTIAAPCMGRFVGPGGQTLAQAQGMQFEYQMQDEAYVRFEAQGAQGQLFLQPMFRQEGI